MEIALGNTIGWVQRYHRPILLLVLVATAAFYGKYILRSWQSAKGFEYEWIAQSLAAGKGFSFDGAHRWLFHIPYEDPQLSYRFEAADPEKYYPTAWMAPVYPTFMALNFALFGEHARLVLLGFNLLFIFLTAWVLFLIGKRIWGPPAGILAAAILLVIPYTALGILKTYIGNVWAAGLLASLCCLALVWCMENLSLRRAIVVGGLIGFTALTHAGTILFAGLAALVVLTAPDPVATRVKAAAGIILATIVVVSPWTLRNYILFDEFIPVRTGAGYVLYKGNPVLGVAIEPSLRVAHPDVIEMWEATSAYDAIQKATRREERRIMHVYSKQMVEANAPQEFADYNEHQRDGVYKTEAVDFIKQHPWVTARLMLAKARYYLFGWGPLQMVIVLFAAIGAIVWFRDKRGRAVLFLLAGVCAPYVLSQPIYYRYRYPAEPLFILLAAGTIVWMIAAIRTRLRQ